MSINHIHNRWEPANFKEWEDVIDWCLNEIEQISHLRKKLNNELKDLKALKKHLLANPFKTVPPIKVIKENKEDET